MEEQWVIWYLFSGGWRPTEPIPESELSERMQEFEDAGWETVIRARHHVTLADITE